MTERTDTLEELAERIAADLFTNGRGTKAERLLLWRDSDQQKLGGWSEKPLADRIHRHLVAHLADFILQQSEKQEDE